jgi:NAD(P)-dependent dehydrogenase (short-subunit alcohol dehydrogenase family)
MSEEYRDHHPRSVNGATMKTGANGIASTGAKGTALITGASAGIGTLYADRLARRGYDLILVARNRERLDALATRIAADTGRSVRVIAADLNDGADLDRVEQVLRTDPAITMLINNAGIGSTAPLLDANVDTMFHGTAVVAVACACRPDRDDSEPSRSARPVDRALHHVMTESRRPVHSRSVAA